MRTEVDFVVNGAGSYYERGLCLNQPKWLARCNAGFASSPEKSYRPAAESGAEFRMQVQENGVRKDT